MSQLRQMAHAHINFLLIGDSNNVAKVPIDRNRTGIQGSKDSYSPSAVKQTRIAE
jgi:hypothetical protein